MLSAFFVSQSIHVLRINVKQQRIQLRVNDAHRRIQLVYDGRFEETHVSVRLCAGMAKRETGGRLSWLAAAGAGEAAKGRE